MSLFLQIMCDNEFQELTHLRETQQFAGKHCSWCVRWVDKSRLSGRVVDLWVAGAFHLLLSTLSLGAQEHGTRTTVLAAVQLLQRPGGQNGSLSWPLPPPHMLCSSGWLGAGCLVGLHKGSLLDLLP